MLGWRGGSDRDRVSVTTQTGRDPENVNLGDRRWFLRNPTVRNCFRCHSWNLLSHLHWRTGVAEFPVCGWRICLKRCPGRDLSSFGRKPESSACPCRRPQHQQIEEGSQAGAPLFQFRGKHYFLYQGFPDIRRRLRKQELGLRNFFASFAVPLRKLRSKSLTAKDLKDSQRSQRILYAVFSVMFHWMACCMSSRALRSDNFSLMCAW